MKFFKIVLIYSLFIVFFINNSVYASMADFTDEDAEKETQKLIQEHKENFDSNKSDNNFLKDLNVTEGTLSPNFDRQVIEYSVKVDNNINEINITANAEDSEAKINGTGKIDISNISEHKIEVVAASGTTRTYFIKIIKENENKTIDKNEKKDEVSDKEFDENIIINNNPIVDNQSDPGLKKDAIWRKKYIVPITIVILIVLVTIIINKNKKSKH